jgi:outer membrane receptor protein involved in Fe transport
MPPVTRLVCVLAGACLLPSLSPAQTAAEPAATPVPAKPVPTPAEVDKKPDTKLAADGTPVELSPFEVRAEDDVGYQAGNTTSGSRLNSRLKDTPASVSTFTPEFLSDIAATNLEEMLGHATNVEIDVEDANAGFNNPQGRGADGNDYTFRMRGSPAGASRDFVDSSVPVDLYNVERAEVASGRERPELDPLRPRPGGRPRFALGQAGQPHPRSHDTEVALRLVAFRALRGGLQSCDYPAETFGPPAQPLPE